MTAPIAHHLPQIREQLVSRLWGYCRTHAGSLESERHCNAIEQLVAAAVERVESVNRNLSDELAEAKRHRTALRRELLAARREIKKLIEANKKPAEPEDSTG